MADIQMDSHVVQAISRVPDQRLQNLVMKHFARYQEEVLGMLVSESERYERLAACLKNVRRVAVDGLEGGEREQALQKILQIVYEGIGPDD